MLCIGIGQVYRNFSWECEKGVGQNHKRNRPNKMPDHIPRKKILILFLQKLDANYDEPPSDEREACLKIPNSKMSKQLGRQSLYTWKRFQTLDDES